MTAFTPNTAPVRSTTALTCPFSQRISVTSACRSVRFSCRSSVCFITCWYSRRSACARSDHTAGPLALFSIRYWMQARSAARAISPPRASSSRTRWPLPVPPMAGLQGMLPTASRSMVKQTVRIPSRAAASAASMPAWPAPMTAISNSPARNSLIVYPQCVHMQSLYMVWPLSAIVEINQKYLRIIVKSVQKSACKTGGNGIYYARRQMKKGA